MLRVGFSLPVQAVLPCGGDLQCAQASPTASVLMLTSLSLQEMASPELQSLALEAKKAAALVKYMPLPAQQLPEIARTLARAPQLEPWMARGSALAFTQVRPLL